jgi:hypothetical protein
VSILKTIKLCWPNAEFLVFNLAINVLGNEVKAKEKKTKYAWNILGAGPPCGKTEEMYKKYKALQCQCVYKEGKTH